jgi:hypothetical protein
MAEINSGVTLYDLNKDLLQNEKAISKTQLMKKRAEVIDFFKEINNNYYMLLCNEQKDYTVFKTDDKRIDTYTIAADELILCLQNRGYILSIERTKDKAAMEIWMRIDEYIFVYYLFGYDMGIIDCT